jgi:type III protein arginine methyltransferase
MNRKQRRAQSKLGSSPPVAEAAPAVSAALLELASSTNDPVATARSLFAADRPADAVKLLLEAAKGGAPNAAVHLALGDGWCELGRFADAAAAFERALALGEAAAARGRRHALSKLVPSWHFAMLNDAPRNEAYAEAIAATVRPGDLVLEIGAGSGLLAMMAARAGATQVISCEQAPPLAAAAREIVAANGYADRVAVIAARSTRLRVGVELPRRADMLIMEVFDTALLGEGVLPALDDARARLLLPDARIVPQRARLIAQVMECAELRAVNPIGQIAGFDLSVFDRFRAIGGQSVELAREPHRPLADPVTLATFDFSRPQPRSGATQAGATIAAAGTAQAVALWFELDLAPGLDLSTAPGGPRNHWRQSLHFLAHDRTLQPGQTVTLSLRYGADGIDVTLD